MVDRTDRELAAAADMKRLMEALLPDVHAILGRVHGLMQAETPEPGTDVAIAADLRLWKEASQRALVPHYNQFEAPLTFEAREREKRENPNAVQEFAEDITRLNLAEAVEEYKAAHVAPEHADGFMAVYSAIESLSNQVDTQGVTSLADKVRRDGWKPGGGGRGSE